MHSAKKFNVIKNIRLVTVIGVGTLGAFITAFLVANGLRNSVNAQASLSDLTAILLGGVLIGLLITMLFCLLAFHAFSFFESTTLPQAIRLSEAMRMLHAKTHQEGRAALRFYRINVFKAKQPLGEDVEENVRCHLISTFLSPWSFRSDQNAAFGSATHCCDFAHIQEIISANRLKWAGAAETQPTGSSVDKAALERKIAELQEKNKEVTQKYTAATGREARAKKRLEEAEGHMAILVELAGKVSKSQRAFTRDEIKAKYRAIGKIHGLTEAPSAYVEIFRNNMPEEHINRGGAPNQGSGDKET